VTGARVHPSAIVEDGVVLGEGTAVWDNAHIRAGAVIGRDCIVGGKTYVAPGVVIGDRVKLNAFVYVCTGVTLRDGVMVGAHAVFTNDRYPRATTADLSALRPSEADDATLPTLVGEGASIGAGAVIGCGIEIGPWAMVGMGAVVTHSVEAHQIVVGNPARARGRACRCGHPVTPLDGVCGHCGRPFPAGSTTAPR
jgi:acetyltransferase-like isoleucine patch superfamily enzyme